MLCNATPNYSPLTTAYDIDLVGEQFPDEDSGYCTCNTDSLGDCDVAEGSTSCTVSATTTYYVNPDFTSETCATTTSNGYTVYDGINGYCTYTDPTDATITCTITVGSSTCSLTTSETCYVDEAATTTTCSSAISSFTNLDGSAEYATDVAASIDWAQYYSTAAGAQYITDVPDGSETGDVQVIATTNAGTQCTSNGLEFPVTCFSCSECGSTNDNLLNCNLDYDPTFGSCTADTAGFCRAEPGSCCNLTSCAYDDTATTADDPGTCAAQPIIQFDDADADALSDYFEITYTPGDVMDPTLQDTDADGTIDSDEFGLSNGNYALEVIDSATFPTPWPRSGLFQCASADSV